MPALVFTECGQFRVTQGLTDPLFMPLRTGTWSGQVPFLGCLLAGNLSLGVKLPACIYI